MFFLPNLLTLILFGFVADYVRKKYEGYTVMDALQNSSQKQQNIHLFVYMLIVLCSTCTQIIGMQMLLIPFINNKLLIAIAISLICLIIVWKNGLKASIITDAYKYIIMFICAVFLLFNTNGTLNLVGTTTLNTWEIFTSFGAITALGLLSGVYSDMTLWQRAFSIPQSNVKKTFIYSGLYFAIIPLIFGIIGFMSGGNGSEWNLISEFDNGILEAALIICVTATLMATLDSNLCAAAAIPCKVYNKDQNYGRAAMTVILVIACVLTGIELFDLTKMFLVYNTVRACIAIPFLLIIFNIYDSKRLFIASLISIILAPTGYVLTENFIFTLAGFLIPLLGLNLKRKKGYLVN